MDKMTEERIAAAAKSFANGATLKEVRGITNDELEAVYSLGFGYYTTGKFEEAQKKAIASYGYSSFLDLENPKPQLHAAECYLALGDKGNAASAIMALEHYCPANTDLGREYRAKAAELRKAIGEEEFKIEE